MLGIVIIVVAILSATEGIRSIRQTGSVPVFSKYHSEGHVDSGDLDEASGLAASRNFPGILYTINDSGGSARIFAINTGGANVQTILQLPSPATNHDWEDIAVGPCGTNSPHNCIYVADTGDSKPGAVNIIYRIMEPTSLTPSVQTMHQYSVLKFNWNEKDAETLMVDPNGELYVIAKVNGGRGTIAHLPSSAWDQTTAVDVTSTANIFIHTNHPDPVGGDISPNGKEVLIKTHNDVLYWPVPHGDYMNVLSTTRGVELPYHQENQGESVCWSADGNKYYTLGEGHHEKLYSYQRLSGGVTVG